MNVTRRSPPKRDRSTIVFLLVVLIILLTIEWYFRGFAVTVSILTKLSCDAIKPFVLLRVFTFFPEVIHVIQLKQYNILHAIQRSIKNNASWNNESALYLIITCAICFGNINPDKSLENKHLGSQETEDVNKICGVVDDLIFYTLMAYYMFRGMGEYPTKKALSIEKEWSSMASGFYYGYLKIILNSLSDRIDLYKCTQKVGEHFKVNKLLVLIPSSTVIFDQVKNVCSEFIQEVGQIEYTYSRALVEKRSYKNTVYRVQDPKSREIHYTLFEGATPIKTFYEQCKEDPTLMDYRRETVYAFYNTLQKLLDNDPNIKDFVELVYYEDDEKPGHGTEQSGLLNIILDRLKEIIRKQEIAKINLCT